MVDITQFLAAGKGERQVGLGVAFVAGNRQLQPSRELGVDDQVQGSARHRKNQELAAPADAGETGAGQRFHQPALGEIAHGDGAAGRQNLDAFDRLAGDAAVEHFADNFEFGQFGHALLLETVGIRLTGGPCDILQIFHPC